MTFSNEEIEALKCEIKKRLSEPRYLHTLGVARAASRLCELCLPSHTSEAAVAALLHDVTKEYSHEEQKRIIKEEDILIEGEDENTPAILHSFTAPAVIRRDFAKFATDSVLSSVLFHTLGSPDMSVFDEIIFLADFIESGRKYPDSVSTAKFVLDSMKKDSFDDNIKILHRACVMEIDSTVAHLNSLGKPICQRTLLARAAILSKI